MTNVDIRQGNNHPTAKPVAPPGGVVIDPFMGSGSTGVAAIREGCDFLGIDQEAEYVDIARGRIESEITKKR